MSERKYNFFHPGRVWLDTAGNPIQAHGGSILTIGDTFYWYGENKERTRPGGRIWHWGIRAYASRDLYNWEDLGVIIPPDETDPCSSLHPESKLDRPHIIHDRESGRFVCWLKVMEEGDRQTRTVLVSDAFAGPYTIVRTQDRDLAMNAGDFDIVVDPSDGKGYTYFERVHSELICADLTVDYTNVSGYYSTHLAKGRPPQVREAPAYFRRGDKHYLLTSGTTHYHPNPSEAAMAESYHGPWITLGDLHPDDHSRTSFNSQISSVFRHPRKKDLYIAIADRWIVDLPEKEGAGFATGDAYRRFETAFGKLFSHPELVTPAENAAIWGLLDSADTSRATFVWLPIVFEGDRPTIAWRDRWSLDEYE